MVVAHSRSSFGAAASLEGPKVGNLCCPGIHPGGSGVQENPQGCPQRCSAPPKELLLMEGLSFHQVSTPGGLWECRGSQHMVVTDLSPPHCSDRDTAAAAGREKTF